MGFSRGFTKDSKIYIAGHRGLVGSAFMRKLESEGYHNIVSRTSAELDLRDCAAVKAFFESEQPEYVFLAAAKVGGIWANSQYPADFIYSNLAIQVNVIHNSYLAGVKKLLFLGSSCIYPKFAAQPMKEEYLLTGVLEPTNEPYAVAKSQASKCARHTTTNTGRVLSRLCPPISMARTIALTLKTLTCCRH